MKGIHISKKASRRIQRQLRNTDEYRNATNRAWVKLRPNPLSRPGIWFTKSQEERIRAFIANGQTYEAQSIIIFALGADSNG